MMDHSEQLLDIMDSSFLEHKDGALSHHNSMSYHMDGVGNLTSGSPLLTSNNGNAYVPYSFLGHDDLSPSSPLTDHSSSDNDIPLSPQSDHPFSEALGGSALFLPPPCVPLVTTPNVSSSSLPLSSRSLVSLPIVSDVTSDASSSSSSIINDGKQRKRKAATSVSVASTKSNSRSKGRRTDSKKEASSAAIKTSSSSNTATSSNTNNGSTSKMASSIPTPTSKPSSIRTTRSGSRAAAAATTSPLVPVHGRDEDKTSIVTPLSGNNDASSSSSSLESNGLSLPSLEAIPDHNGILATPPHMMAAMGNLAVMGAVTLAQPEYERMLAEEERTKEKKMRKAEQARISRQKKKDRMTLLEESVAMYKQQIAHLQSLPAATTAAASSPHVPTPVPAAERKSAISPVWQRSSTSSGSSSNDGNGNNDDTRSVQSGDDSSSSSGSSITAASPMHAPATAATGVAITVPVLSSSPLAIAKEVATDIATPMMTPVASPPVVVEDEVNGEAIQRCIQTIITSSYPAANAAASPNGASLSSYGLMATGSVHAGGASDGASSADSKDGQSSSAVDTLNNNIQGLFDMFAKRAHATESHLESLDKLLVPSMPLRFLEWSLTQNEKFYSDPNGLWHCLWSKTLSLTTEQMTSLASLRSDVVAQRTAEAEIRMQALNMTGIVVGSTPSITTTSNDGTAATATSTTTFPVTSISPRSLSLSSTLSLQAAYSQLSALSRLHLAASNRWLRTLATILTPLQVARYFEWVNIYGHICVQINI